MDVIANVTVRRHDWDTSHTSVVVKKTTPIFSDCSSPYVYGIVYIYLQNTMMLEHKNIENYDFKDCYDVFQRSDFG